MNLLTETIEKLNYHNLTPEDVQWVGNINIKTDWKNFEEISNVEYNNGFGSQNVAVDLLIVGKDWWLERHEHDGSEWWQFKKVPEEPTKNINLTKTVGGMWTKLEQLQE